MLIVENDFPEINRVSEIVRFVENMDIHYADKESEVIYRKQPFILSLILGYGMDLNKEELGEVIKVLFIIWEYFKVNNRIGTVKVTEEQYERITAKNLHMLKYYEGEPGESEKLAVIEADLFHLNSKTLFAAVIFRFKTNKTLLNLNEETRGIILVGMKTMIECLEEIVKK